jgi:hypothetical protein
VGWLNIISETPKRPEKVLLRVKYIYYETISKFICHFRIFKRLQNHLGRYCNRVPRFLHFRYLKSTGVTNFPIRKAFIYRFKVPVIKEPAIPDGLVPLVEEFNNMGQWFLIQVPGQPVLELQDPFR